jgi:AraC-like DNA-binding protein
MRTNSRTPAVWTGEIDLAPKWALFVGAGGRTRRHSHPVHKLVVQIAPPVSVVSAHLLATGVWFVRGRDEHVVIARGRVALLFLDVGALSDAEIANLRSSIVAAAEGLRAEDRMVRAEAASALAAAAPRVLDARVAEAAAILRSEAGTGVDELARRVGLSATRLTHLFTAQVGVAPRRYRGWGALRRALAEMARGRSLTEVAHAAGFSDAAHFSRSFAKFLGVVPSSLSPIVVRGG